MRPQFFLTVILLLVTLLPESGGAAMYAYVDARGICHYTNVPGTGRYRLSKRPPRRVGSPEDRLVRTISRHSRSVLAPAKLSRHSERSLRSSKERVGSGPRALNRFIHLAAREHKLDPLLIKAVIKAESNFDPKAISSKGAQGLMQLMPGTARDLDVDDPFDPAQNINGGAKYLRSLLDNFDQNVELTLAAYNAGPGRVAPHNVIPNIPETKNYVAKVLENYRSYKRGSRTARSVNKIKVRQMVTIN